MRAAPTFHRDVRADLPRSTCSFVRYDRGVRTVLIALALLVAVGARDASSKPARMDRSEPEERAVPFEPCGSGKVWKSIETCLAKDGALRILYEAEGVKVVEVAFRPPSTNTRLSLYTLRERLWIRESLYAAGSTNNALLGVTAFASPLGLGVRVDMGQTYRTSVSFNEGSARGVVRRVTSTVCVPGAWLCRAVMTSCDTYVRGHLVWMFHGAITWHASLGLRLQGDTTRAGGMCTPPRMMLDGEERD
jgi:hypothetical protein